MNTHAHAILNLFLLRKIFGEKKHKIPYFNSLVVLGSILPDLPMFFFFFFYTFIVPTTQSVIWRELYFTDSWQIIFNLFNSVPLFLLIVGIALILKNKSLLVFSIANLMHFVADFFLHQADAHAHFFPFSNYKFFSPVSYWNSNYYGNYFGIFEILLVLGLSIPLWRGLKNKWWRALIVLVNLVNLLGLVMWGFIFRVF